MKEFNPERHRIETASALEVVTSAGHQEHHAAYVGLDVHKEAIAVAVAEPGRAEPVYRGEIANKPKSIEKLIGKLSAAYDGALLQFCYEAGPCGYVLYRQILACGHDCQVVAPSRIPRTPGERIKTDRRDALKLARLLRAGDLTAVWVPDRDQEMMRDLSRARDDMKGQERKARQQLNAFVLRHGHHWPRGKSRWTQAHYNWLESLRFEHPWQQVTLQEYIDAVKAASARVAQLSGHLMRALPEWSLAPVVDSLIALRGIDKLAATVLLAELGDISRFDSPRELMAFLGLVPSEHTSGPRRRQGGITLTGNGHARPCWSNRPGATGFRPAKPCTSSARRSMPRNWPRRLLGRPRYACAGAIARLPGRGRTPRWSAWRSPASWPASSGTSCASRWRARHRRRPEKAAHQFGRIAAIMIGQ